MAEETNDTETNEVYYLRKGATHNAIVGGNAREWSGDKGEGVPLSAEQYESFKDKFLPLGEKNRDAEPQPRPEVTGLAPEVVPEPSGDENNPQDVEEKPQDTGKQDPEPSAEKPAVAPGAVVTGDAKPAGAQPAKVDTAGDVAKK